MFILPLVTHITLKQRLTASMPMHPLPILLNQGVPVALSSDDPAMFQNMGLSFDFYQVDMMSLSVRR